MKTHRMNEYISIPIEISLFHTWFFLHRTQNGVVKTWSHSFLLCCYEFWGWFDGCHLQFLLCKGMAYSLIPLIGVHLWNAWRARCNPPALLYVAMQMPFCMTTYIGRWSLTISWLDFILYFNCNNNLGNRHTGGTDYITSALMWKVNVPGNAL